jgi:hypothetical protein
MPTRVTLRTDAEIASTIRYGIATGDLLELSPDRKELTLEFIANGLPRHLVVQTRPPRSMLKLEATSDGKPLASDEIRLGKEGRHPAVFPLVLDASELEVSVVEAELLLHRSEAPLWAWYVRPGERVDLDEETLGVLKALGYIQ